MKDKKISELRNMNKKILDLQVAKEKLWAVKEQEIAELRNDKNSQRATKDKEIGELRKAKDELRAAKEQIINQMQAVQMADGKRGSSSETIARKALSFPIF